eukprot:Pgem_evm1s15294
MAKGVDAMALLVMAYRYRLPRLVALCELYLTAAISEATTEGIANSNISIVNTLLVAIACGAKQ